MLTSTKNIRITRVNSLSSIGRRCDRDFAPLRKLSPNPTLHRPNKSASLKAIDQSHSASKEKGVPRKRENEMKVKIKQEIDQLRAGATKGKKLTLSTKT